jgi:hypothetical protein
MNNRHKRIIALGALATPKAIQMRKSYTDPICSVRYAPTEPRW